ncbi:MAG TPA: cyclic nucleotide-binding domain-containing protein [Marmoricola sp.]|nr:cyclic nucleotide-binding domain-containing protein [Marmoricola sp.]
MSNAGLDALRVPDIRRLELGWALSLTGTFSYTVAMLAYAYAEGGAHLVAAYGVASTVPGALITPLLMGLTDRVGAATMLRATTALRTLLVALAAAGAFADAPGPLVVALAAGAHSLSATFRPTQATSLPWLAHTPAELTAATVTATMAENLAALIGPVLAGIVLAAWDARTAIAVSGACLLLATASLLRLSVPDAARPARTPRSDGLVRGMLEGATALSRIGRPAGLVVIAFAQTFVRGALLVLMIVLALDTLALGEDSIGWLNAAIGVGGLAGAVVAARVVHMSILGRCLVVGVGGWGLGVLALSGSPTGLVAFTALVLVGVANAFQDASAFIMMPRLLGPEVAGRAMGAFELVVMAGMGSGSLLAPALVDWLGARGALACVGGALFVLAVAYLAPFATIDREMPQPPPEAALLRTVSVFAPLPLMVIEQLALAAEARSFTDGEVVTREGDRGSTFYVVTEGSAAVSVGGEPRPALGPGEGFGEIALLHDVPRTATVTAAGPLQVLGIARETFLGAITDNQLSAEQAHALAGQRLTADRRTG